MTVTAGFPAEISFSNISATTADFSLKGGLYGVTVIGSTFGTVTLSRLAADGATYVTCLTAFSANGYASVYLPKGHYKLVISATTAVYADICAILET